MSTEAERLAFMESALKHILVAVDDLKREFSPRMSKLEADMHAQALEMEKMKSELKLQRISLMVLAVGGLGSGGALISRILGG